MSRLFALLGLFFLWVGFVAPIEDCYASDNVCAEVSVEVLDYDMPFGSSDSLFVEPVLFEEDIPPESAIMELNPGSDAVFPKPIRIRNSKARSCTQDRYAISDRMKNTWPTIVTIFGKDSPLLVPLD